MSATDFEQLKREFQDAWCTQADGVPFRIEFVRHENSTKHVRVGRVELHRADQPKDPDTKWWGYFAVIRKDPRTASDCLVVKELCRRAGAALPRSFRDPLHGFFAFSTDQPDDLWLTLLAILDGVTWPPTRSYFQGFNPFEASVDAIERCGLDTGKPCLSALSEAEAESVPFLVSVQDLKAITGGQAPIETIRDHLNRIGLKPYEQKGVHGSHQYPYRHVVAQWNPDRLRGPLPAEDEARKRLDQHRNA